MCQCPISYLSHMCEVSKDRAPGPVKALYIVKVVSQIIYYQCSAVTSLFVFPSLSLSLSPSPLSLNLHHVIPTHIHACMSVHTHTFIYGGERERERAKCVVAAR